MPRGKQRRAQLSMTQWGIVIRLVEAAEARQKKDLIAKATYEEIAAYLRNQLELDDETSS